MMKRRSLLVAAALCAATAAYAADMKPADKAAADKSAAPAGDCSRVQITTSQGPITIELDRAKAPVTVDNFVGYVKSGFYDGTIFHRVIDGFMIQGGGFTKEMQQKPTKPPIAIESKNGLHNGVYTVAMARTNDPNSATAQFFINVVDNARLDYSGDMSPGYTVFGKVVAGTEVVDKIKTVPTSNQGMFQNVPMNPVTIEKAQCVAAGAAKQETKK
jgi:peptidyl-prolyl cis-trans isomerase A (cyclophilin A)